MGTDLLDCDGELVETIGKVAALSLAERFGGTRLYVPRSLHAEHPIVTTIGPILAAKLAAVYAPDMFRVPLLKTLRIAKMRHEGLSIAQIATAMIMTESGVDKTMRRLKELDEPLWP
jgi:hypothetical protein